MAGKEDKRERGDPRVARTSFQVPEVVCNALADGGIEVGGIKLGRFTLGTFLALQKMAHPILNGKRGTKLTNEDVLRLIFVLAFGGKKAIALLAANMLEDAIMDMTENIDLAALPKLGDALGTLFERALSTSGLPDTKKKDGSPMSPGSPGTAGS
jgi:hypothetical protein